MRSLRVLELGTVRYDEALALQHRMVEQRRAGEVADTVLLLEHPPVVTVGRGDGGKGLRCSPEELARRGIELFEVERGGQTTYHGPGQLVCYPILDLAGLNKDLHWYLRALEEAVIAAVDRFGLRAVRREGLTGVWLPAGKLCAIGVAVRHWITFHGLALNVDVDMEPFALIDPCGLAEQGVTSMRQALGRQVCMQEVREAVVQSLAEVFGFARAHAGHTRQVEQFVPLKR
ncbi:MAG: lipoyl(octanoyl) transferase LipB [Armatimonadota bacterium]